MFWENYLRLCNEIGKSPSAVATEIGLSNAAPTGWKKGATPRDSVLRSLASYFGVSVEYLLGDDTKKAPTENGERSNDKLSMLVSLFERLPPEEQNDVIFQLLSRAQAQLDQDGRK